MQEMMYYQLIMLKAQDKFSCIQPNVTKIATIVHFYESNYDPILLPQAYYFAANFLDKPKTKAVNNGPIGLVI